MKVSSGLHYLVLLLYFILLVMDSAVSFGASLFGNRFLYRSQRYRTRPNSAYRLRKPYRLRFGPFGDNFINTISSVPLYHKPVTSKPFVIAPFGTEGFTLSPEEEEIRKKRKERRERKRRQRGHREDKVP